MARKPKIDSTSEGKAPREPDAIVSFWMSEIEAAKKREKDYREDGLKYRKIYGGTEAETTPFNILYSNTETLLPSLYSTVPRPVVDRRFKVDDPIGKAAALAGQRALEFLLDTNVEGYETYDEGMRAAVIDALIPGRGITCVKYDASIGEMGPPSGDDEAQPAVSTPYTKSELVCLESREWNRVYYGYAKKWSKVPWIAYEEHIDRDEAERLFGAEKARQLTYTDNDDQDKEERSRDEEKNQGARKTVCVYQIWDKDGGRKIRYVSAQYKDGYLKVEDDPLQLTGFFNQPRPLQLIEKTSDLVPIAPYALYENQANELNKITLRINKLVDAIKARGIYDSELGDDLKTLMSADDNALVPADKSSSLAAEKGLDNAIWFMPIEQLVNTLGQMIQAREQCKRVIYEITGLSDIIRGSTVASETATAQQIKTQWGTLRLKRLQKEIQRFSRDLLRMMLEIAAAKFSEDTWAKMTGLPFVTTAERQQLATMAQAVQKQAGVMQAQGQQPTPEQVQQVGQLKQRLQAPQWAQVQATLRDDMQRAYKIDIETNSTVEPEAVEDQKNLTELFGAIGQYLNGVGPLVKEGILPFGVAQSMLLAITRRFRFGNEIEDYIKEMRPPKPEDDGKAQAAQQQAAQKEAQFAQEKTQGLAKIAQLETELKNEQRERALNERANALAIDQIKFDTEKTIFEMEKKNATERMTEKNQAQQSKIAGETKIKSAVEQSAKREQQVAKSADDKITKAVVALQDTVKQLVEAVGQPLVQQQAIVTELTREVTALARAVTAPRRRTAVRDSNNRISHSIDEPVTVQ